MSDNSLGEADFYDPGDYVGIGRRLVVIVIDSSVLLILGVLVWMPFMALILLGSLQKDPSGWFWICYLLVAWLYLGPLKRSGFGTIGYRIFGIKLVSTKGGPPSLFTMTMRMLMWMFGPFNLILDLLWLGADSENQSLRDCYLQTYLIKKNAKPVGRAPVHLTRYTAMGFALAYPRVSRPKNVT